MGLILLSLHLEAKTSLCNLRSSVIHALGLLILHLFLLLVHRLLDHHLSGLEGLHDLLLGRNGLSHPGVGTDFGNSRPMVRVLLQHAVDKIHEVL